MSKDNRGLEDALNILAIFGIFILAGLITTGFIIFLRWLINLLI